MGSLKIPLNYGSLAGMVAFAAFLFYYFVLGQNPLGDVSWLSSIIPIIFVYLGVKKYRDEEREGYIDFGFAFTAGLLISFTYATLFAMLVYLFGWSISSEFVDMHINESIEALEKVEELTRSLLGDDNFEEDYENTYKDNYNNIINSTAGIIVWGDARVKMMGGAIVSLIVAAIVKKKQSPIAD